MVERASPFAEPVAGERAGIRLDAVPRGSLWQIACWPERFAEVERALGSACGCAAPGPGRMARTQDGRLLARVEPLKWWVIGPDGARCPLTLGPDRGACLDLSHDQAGIAVAGDEAAELLKRFVALDLRESELPDLSFATTELHHMITRVLRTDQDGPHYEIWVMRSYADTLREVVEHHLAQFGVTA